MDSGTYSIDPFMDNSVNYRLFSKLYDGRAFTLIEISKAIGLSRSKTQKQLNTLVKQGILYTRKNRKRTYYYLGNQDFLNQLKKNNFSEISAESHLPKGIKYCRHCYKHLAGYVGVAFAEAMVKKGFLTTENLQYKVTDKGRKWFARIGVNKDVYKEDRLAIQCLDFSERKSHLGGKLGDALLSVMFKKNWVKQVPKSREIQFTTRGRSAFLKELDLLIEK